MELRALGRGSSPGPTGHALEVEDLEDLEPMGLELALTWASRVM